MVTILTTLLLIFSHLADTFWYMRLTLRLSLANPRVLLRSIAFAPLYVLCDMVQCSTHADLQNGASESFVCGLTPCNKKDRMPLDIQANDGMPAASACFATRSLICRRFVFDTKWGFALAEGRSEALDRLRICFGLRFGLGSFRREPVSAELDLLKDPDAMQVRLLVWQWHRFSCPTKQDVRWPVMQQVARLPLHRSGVDG